MSGGGGVSGAVSFPSYIEDNHKSWINRKIDPVIVLSVVSSDNSVQKVLETALDSGGNPFTPALLFTDPTADLNTLDTEWNTVSTALDAVVETTDWNTIIDSIIAKIDAVGSFKEIDIATMLTAGVTNTDLSIAAAVTAAVNAVSSADLATLVTAYTADIASIKAEAKTSLAGTMASINAVNSSAYMFGLALIEDRAAKDIAKFDADATLSMYNETLRSYVSAYVEEIKARLQAGVTDKSARDIVLRDGLAQQVNMKLGVLQLESEHTKVYQSIQTLRASALAEYDGAELDADVQESLWDLKVFNMAANVLAAPAGMAAVLPEKPSRFQQIASFAFSAAGAVSGFIPGGGGK